MVQSRATSVNEYLASLPEDRRRELEAVRKVILDNIDPQIEEIMQYGMIGYAIPHSIYPKGYHCDPRQPLCYAGLAAQKQHLSLYLMCTYGDEALNDWFRAEWARTGKKLDMGKACIRFKRAADVALDVIAATLRRMPAATYIEGVESFLAQAKAAKAQGKAAKAAKTTTASTSRATAKKATTKAAPKATTKKASAKAAPKAAAKSTPKAASKATAKKATATRATLKAATKATATKATAKATSKVKAGRRNRAAR